MVLAFDSTAVLVAVLTGSAVTGLLTYLGQRFVFSGRVRTTNADTLWKEGERGRSRLEKENERLRSTAEETTSALFDVRSKLLDMGAKVNRATLAAVRWRERERLCRVEIARLKAEIDRLKGGGS